MSINTYEDQYFADAGNLETVHASDLALEDFASEGAELVADLNSIFISKPLVNE